MLAFQKFQPEYAAHKIASFPVDRATKKPSVRHYAKVGLRGSAGLVSKFRGATAIGFCAGPRSRLTVLDVDEPGKAGERTLGDLGDRHGHSRLIVRTSGGKFHAYYRHNGEDRKIRPFGDGGPKVDILGAGLVIAAPSELEAGNYQIIQGCLDDLDALSPLHDLPEETKKTGREVSVERARHVARGERNNALFRHCLRSARYCDSLDALIDEARTFCDEDMFVPLPDGEIVNTAKSAWGYQERGENWHGTGRERPENWLMDANQDAYMLYALTKRFNSGRAEFLMTHNMAERFGWRRERVALARNFLIEHGFVRRIRASRGRIPAVYTWGSPAIKT